MSPLGRCDFDGVVWRWENKPQLWRARCPICGGHLASEAPTNRTRGYPRVQAAIARDGKKRKVLALPPSLAKPPEEIYGDEDPRVMGLNNG
jgi:hypothetical protein